MTAARRAAASPSIRVDAAGRVGTRGSAGFSWIVHDRSPRVAFLVTPLVGLSGGEELTTNIELGARSDLVVTGQGPTTLLRTESAPSLTWRLELGEGAHLTYLPWTTIPFPGASVRSELIATLARDSSLVMWETLALGRIARGEQFLFDRLSWTFELSLAGRLAMLERLRVTGEDAEVAAAMLAGRTHVGTLVIAGPGDDALPLDDVWAAVAGRADLAGASRPDPAVLVVRALERSAERLERAFWPVVCAARRALALPPLADRDVGRRGLAAGR